MGIGSSGECWGASLMHDTADNLQLTVVLANDSDNTGTRPSGYKNGDRLSVLTFDAAGAFEALNWRYREKVRQQWPPSYRFQVTRRSWRAVVEGPDGKGGRCQQACVLQMAASNDERTLQNVELDLQDAKDATVYAHRFNLFQSQYATGRADLQPVEGEAVPGVQVAMPVACEVNATCYPSMIPIGCLCTVAVYPLGEVRKFVFDGSSDEFEEIPQAFFHYAAYSSGGKEFVVDCQGDCDDDGGLLLVDPCILRSGPVGVADLVGAAVPKQAGAAESGPSSRRFDALHPKCGAMCKTFDPHRKCATRKAGMCGTNITCGF